MVVVSRRDLISGEIVRFFHSNSASLTFLFLFLHVIRGAVFRRFYLTPVWGTGITIFLFFVVVSFLGYSLP